MKPRETEMRVEMSDDRQVNPKRHVSRTNSDLQTLDKKAVVTAVVGRARWTAVDGDPGCPDTTTDHTRCCRPASVELPDVSVDSG